MDFFINYISARLAINNMVTIQTGLHYKPFALRRILQHMFSKVHDSLCVQSTGSWSSTNSSSFLLNILLLRWKPFSQGRSSAQQIIAGRRLLPFLVPSFHPRPHQPLRIYKSNKPCIILSMYIDRQSYIHIYKVVNSGRRVLGSMYSPESRRCHVLELPQQQERD